MEATKEAEEMPIDTAPLPPIIPLTAMQRRALNSVLDDIASLTGEIQKLQLLLTQTNKEGDEILAEIESVYGLEKDTLKTAFQYNRKEFLQPLER